MVLLPIYTGQEGHWGTHMPNDTETLKAKKIRKTRKLDTGPRNSRVSCGTIEKVRNTLQAVHYSCRLEALVELSINAAQNRHRHTQVYSVTRGFESKKEALHAKIEVERP